MEQSFYGFKVMLERNWVFFWFSIPFILATQCRRPLIFQTLHYARPKNLSLRYQRFTPSDCKDIGIRRFELVGKLSFFKISWLGETPNINYCIVFYQIFKIKSKYEQNMKDVSILLKIKFIFMIRHPAYAVI